VYGVKKVVSRILDPERGDIFAHFGLETVCPTKLTVEAICSAIKPMLEEKYVSFGSHMVRFTTMEIPKEFIGMTPVDIEYEENETLYAIIRADSTMEIVNNYNVVMREGDKLIFSKAI
ncbi:TrkA-N domain protein, partial [human gut metagenome]